MATARLIPSTYSLSNTSLTVSNASNFYSNTDSTSYGSVATTSTSSRYIYLKGFNFDDIPAGAIVNSFTVKYKASESTLSTSSSYYPRLCHNTTTITGTASGALTTSVAVYTFTGVTADWDTISDYGDNFAVRFTVRRSGNSGTGYLYLYGVEIYVDYTVPTAATVTSTLTGSGTINPSGATSTYEGATYTLTITPTTKTDEVTAKNNGTDITSQLVAHYNDSSINQTATAFTTEINGSGGNFYTGQDTTGNYFNYAVGHTAESPGSTSTSYNTYVKDGGSNTATGYAWYTFDFSGIPSGATILSVQVKCYGACESTTHDSTHKANIVLYSGSTAKSTEQYFTSTNNATITISSPGTWTRAELQNAKLRFEVAYYGGRLFGITWTVTYRNGNDPDYYTYTYTVTGNATIAVTIGSVTPPANTISFKNNGSWVAAVKVYKKVNGSWVQQTDLTSVFDPNTHYVKGG